MRERFLVRPSARSGLILVSVLGFQFFGSVPAGAQPPARQEALDRLLAGQPVGGGAGGISAARVTWSQEGAVRFLAPPAGAVLPVPEGTGPAPEPGVAFLRAYRDLFGMEDPRTDLAPLGFQERGQRRFTRLRQTVSGVPVFGARVNVQTAASGGVEAVLADVATRLEGVTSLIPRMTAEEAAARARALGESRGPVHAIEVRAPALELFAPEVLGLPGDPVLVWVVEVGLPFGGSFRLLLDAGSGGVVREYPLELTALDRQIYDARFTSSQFDTLVRDEGDPPCGIADADASYDQIGSSYLYFFVHHSRNSWDNGGGVIRSSVQYCSYQGCPWANATWDGFYGNIKYGAGWAVDDITGHEFTHGVTESESGLIYENASGAINESLSDLWGEFIDLEDPAGGFDDPGQRWLIGEALRYGILRDMSDPPAYGNPDRLGNPLASPVASNPGPGNDYGGVHNNSGINNKLAYLLTDGGAFNGQAIYGMGTNAVAALYYEANLDLLVPGSDWVDLFNALLQSARNLGWSNADRENLVRACLAVEIGIFVVDPAGGCPIQTGVPACTGLTGPFLTVGTGFNTVGPGSTLQIQGGTYPENLSLDKHVWLRAKSGPVRIGQ